MKKLLLPVFLLMLFLVAAVWAKGGGIKGIVITSAGGAGFGAREVQGADVIIVELGSRTVTSGSGTFEFKNIKPGRYTVLVQKAELGASSKSVVVDEGVVHQIIISLTPGGGMTVDQGPIAPGTAYIAFGSISGAMGMAGSSISPPDISQQMTKLGYLQAISAGADPFSLGMNAPMPPATGDPFQYQTVVSVNPNSLMILDPLNPGKPGYITLSKKPLRICFNVSGTTLYVATEENRLELYDILHNNLLLGSLQLPGMITDLTTEPSGGKLYIAVAGGTPGVMVLDTQSNALVQRIPAPNLSSGELGQPRAVSVSRGGYKVYMALSTPNSGEVAAVNSATHQLDGIAPVGMMPIDMLLSPDGTYLYVANYNGGDVAVLEAWSLQVKARIRVGVQPTSLALTPDGKKLFVVNNGSNYVSVIDTNLLQTITTIPTGKSPLYCALTPDGRTLMVGNNGEGTVNIIDAAKNSVRFTSQALPLSQPYGIVIKP